MAVENILKYYERATDWDYQSGLNWYPGARQWCQHHARKHGFDVEVVAAVVAVLSPRNKWSNNLKDAEEVLASVASGENHPFNVKTHTTRIFTERAWTIAKTGDTSLVQGPKVEAFFDNILRPDKSEDVTVDVWACRVADDDLKARAGDFSEPRKVEIVEEYREAAEQVDLTPLEIQAVTWVIARRLAKISQDASQLVLPI